MERLNLTEKREITNSALVKIENIGFVTYDRVLFGDLSLNIRRGDVVAVTGKSGSGKTVFLKTLAGIEHEQDGSIDVSKNIKVEYVPQEISGTSLDINTTIQQLFKADKGLIALEDKIANFEKSLALNEVSYDEIQDEYGELVEQFEHLGGYEAESNINRFLSGLGVDEKTTGHITLETKLTEVSSGQLKKILLAKALYLNPDLLLLDDPTSHLDIAAVEWLAEYLKATSSGIVFASNNQDFIDKCVNKTIGLTDSGRVFIYNGGYTEFIQKRDSQIDAEKSAAESVSRKVDQLQATDNMFRAKNAYNRSQTMGHVGKVLSGRIDRLTKMLKEMPGSQQIYRSDNLSKLIFEEEFRSGNDVLTINRVVKRYQDFTALDLRKTEQIDIKRGQKWLIWGPNGAGKSTLVRMIAHQITNNNFKPDEGEIKVGSNLKLGYFAPDLPFQEKHGNLIENGLDLIDSRQNGRVASVLRFFGFINSAIYNQNISTLSTGERKRFSLSKLMLSKPNLLILDEPTGDYMANDIRDRFALALNEYSGTLLLVSHDVDFISRINFDRQLQIPSGKIIVKN